MSQDRNKPLVMPATLEECETVMEQLSADCTAVRGQIDAARAGVKTSGQYADANWFHRANTALRWMSRDRQRLQEHMAKLRRAKGADGARLLDKRLIAALREHVSAEVFQACLETARIDQAGGAPEGAASGSEVRV